MPPSPKRLDELAIEYEGQKAIVAAEQEKLDKIREYIITVVEHSGFTPPRATKTKALMGDEFELRVSHPAEVTVDTGMALRIRGARMSNRCGVLFRRLFHEVETFTLAGGAHKVIAALPKSAPRGLRAMFARAISVRDLAPQLEIRERSRGQRAEKTTKKEAA